MPPLYNNITQTSKYGKHMILGLGVDIIEINRIAKTLSRFGDTFAKKILHPQELQEFMHLAVKPHHRKIQFMASRFAAKEATAKALGTGFTNGIAFADIAVVRNAAGKPELHLYNKAMEHAQKMNVNSLHISLSHTNINAIATVTLERLP